MRNLIKTLRYRQGDEASVKKKRMEVEIGRKRGRGT